MKFCKECGSLVYPKEVKKDHSITYYCKQCGHIMEENSVSEADLVISSDLNTNQEKTVWFIKANSE